jgi:hypothetical protein
MSSCDSFDLGVNGRDDFADYCCVVPPDSVRLGNVCFSFRNNDAAECFEVIIDIMSNAVSYEGIFPKFLKIRVPFIIRYVLHVFNHAITCSVFSTIWKNFIVQPVAKFSGRQVRLIFFQSL